MIILLYIKRTINHIYIYIFNFNIFSRFNSHRIPYNPKVIGKIIIRIFGHPQGRGRATPIFGQKSKFGISSKFHHHRVANDQLKFLAFFQAFWVTLRGVAGPRPFFGKN